MKTELNLEVLDVYVQIPFHNVLFSPYQAYRKILAVPPLVALLQIEYKYAILPQILVNDNYYRKPLYLFLSVGYNCLPCSCGFGI